MRGRPPSAWLPRLRDLTAGWRGLWVKRATLSRLLQADVAVTPGSLRQRLSSRGQEASCSSSI